MSEKKTLKLIRDLGLALTEQPRFVWPDKLKRDYNRITKQLTNKIENK